MEIRFYKRDVDEERLLQMVQEEGEEWSDYWLPQTTGKYREALHNAITYVAYEGNQLCGFTRSLDDSGLNILLMDLLVAPAHRGKDVGRQLINQIGIDFPDHAVYVLSDNDEYYEHLGFNEVGTVFDLRKKAADK